MSNVAQNFYQNIALGAYSSIVEWSKIGYTPTMNATESDIWSNAGVYAFPQIADGYPKGLEVYSSNAQDSGTYIHGNAQGANAIVCDATGSATELNDTSVNFLTDGGVAAVAGDYIIIDPYGASPEWGIITTVAATKLTFANGLSAGGNCATARPYSVLDFSAFSGAQAIQVRYLTGTYTQKTEIIKLAAGEVATVNTDYYRINSFRIIATGSGYKAAAAVQIREIDNAPIFSSILAGFTRARNVAYTVPTGMTLYITDFTPGYGLTGASKVEYARIYLKANVEPSTYFLTNNIFYPFYETTLGVGALSVPPPIPLKFPAKTDLRVSGVASDAGIASVTLRGFLVTN